MGAPAVVLGAGLTFAGQLIGADAAADAADANARIAAQDIKLQGRNTQGYQLLELVGGERVVEVTRAHRHSEGNGATRNGANGNGAKRDGSSEGEPPEEDEVEGHSGESDAIDGNADTVPPTPAGGNQFELLE